MNNTIQRSSGNVKLTKDRDLAVLDATVINETSDPEICTYATSLFGKDFSFKAKEGLTGSDVYSICEGLYDN